MSLSDFLGRNPFVQPQDFKRLFTAHSLPTRFEAGLLPFPPMRVAGPPLVGINPLKVGFDQGNGIIVNALYLLPQLQQTA